MPYQSYNPFTQKIIRSYEYISDDELINSLEKSNRVFQSWKRTSLEERFRPLNNLADILDSEAEEHAAVMTAEMGKPVSQAIAEVRKSAHACRYYAQETEAFLKPRDIVSKNSSSRIIYQPQGSVFAIMPWNFPYWQVIRCFAPAVASGNSFILKHASNVPACATKLEETIIRAGFPEGLFQNLFLTHDQTSEVIESRYVRTISLTGSNIAGEIIAAKAGSVTKSCVMELGGSDPFVVFNDADISKAAEAAVTGRFQNNGQSCIATKRLFLHNDIYDEFMDIFKDRVRNLKVGNPMDPATDIGPLADKEAVIELKRQVIRSLEMGARVSLGEIDSRHGDAFFEPMILEDVPYDSPVSTEETFGPVIPVYRFSEYDEMITRVNSSIFGLGSSVWTENAGLIDKFTRDIDAGMVAVNGFTRSDPTLPFGGVKSSGFGRELSENGIMEFLNIKTISVFD